MTQLPSSSAEFSQRPAGSRAHARAAVLGHPIAHSLSPALHLAAYRSLGLDWSYEAVDLTEEQLAPWLEERGNEWVGVSLTMPLKEQVLPLLTAIDPGASQVRAVNTVLFEEGRRRGFNTDISGLAAAISDSCSLHDAEVVVLGGGATARSAIAAVAQLREQGAGISRVVVCTRRPEAAIELVSLAGEFQVTASIEPWPPTKPTLQGDLVVSTVPAAASTQLSHAVPAHPGVLVDVVYDPWPTPFASAWRESGGKAVGGLEMLVHQAVGQVRLMTGRTVPAAILRAAGQAELDRRGIAQAEQ
ncbi:MAG TPA: shikimate dehydrogenase [Actinomycetes bacterium]|nr:shikimate dehydrogenase [Actinomycetes bacterium]